MKNSETAALKDRGFVMINKWLERKSYCVADFK